MLHRLARRGEPPVAASQAETDVCLIVEGCYPFIRGGVSSWTDWLMRSTPELSYSMVSVWPDRKPQTLRYQRPDNLAQLNYLYLHDTNGHPRLGSKPQFDPPVLAAALTAFIAGGGMRELAVIDKIVNPPGKTVTLIELLNSPATWQVAEIMYEAAMPHASFLHYFWAWRALFGGLFATLKCQLPKARVYHTISTGYAGLIAARASVETGRPSLITEHGIYTNERRIEILMADWISDTIDKGLSLDDPRFDLRDMWINAFEAYAKACYEASSRIVTLYGDNQVLQRMLGAKPAKLSVIANGLDSARFADIKPAGDSERPTVALIGRVVPIKDVKTFIAAVAEARRRIPQLRALVLGPTDEDPAYFAECVALANSLDLGGCLDFTGNVQIAEWLPRIHVVALTSLSEAQPLVLLEAGSAAIPCITTNVGCCSEIVNGRADEVPNLGPGGLITRVVAPAEIAAAIVDLLTDSERRRKFGDSLRRRVAATYSNAQAVSAYRELYAEYRGLPGTGGGAERGE